MPEVKPGAKVLVSGANGYVAVWVVHTLLESGYHVRGTVRSMEKGIHLKKIFSTYGDRLELVTVPDITKEGAFDEAVEGVDAIEHTASPFHFDAEDPQALIGPAVNGTVNMLQSALKHGTSVKRVVVTSSCAAVLQVSPNPQTFSEKDWNEQAVRHVEQLGKNASNPDKYRASKTLAEKVAWEFWNKNKTSVSWDLVVLNPPFVFGPGIHEVSSPESLNTSLLAWYNTVVLGKSLETSVTEGSCWIDVRDLAAAHVRAIQIDLAGGERIIVSNDPFIWQNWVDMANTLAQYFPNLNLPRGYPEKAKNAVHLISYDTAKADRILKMQYRSMEETARDMLNDFEKRGWLDVAKK